MNIIITHTVDPKVISLIEAFFSGVAGPSQSKSSKTNGKALPESVAPAAVVDEAKETPAPVTETVTASAITIEQIRASVQQKSQAGKREEIKKILSDFGVEKVTNLSKDQYADFHAKIASL